MTWKKGTLVRVDWLDAQGDDGWVGAKKATRMRTVKASSVGYVIADDAERIVIAGTKNSLNDYGGVMCVPYCMVAKVEALT